MKKKLISTILCGAMALSMVTPAFAAKMNFEDVPKEAWFYDDVKTAVESGLVNGKKDNEYCPDDNLTYAEAIKLAACMNQIYNDGKVTLKAGSPWYQTYIDYCEENDIIDRTYSPDEKATRAGYMEIFANCLPEEALEAINEIADNSIPDVPSKKSFANAVYKLYKAGILMGVDDEHNCNPNANIRRSEVAAILTRMMNADKRVKFSIGESEEPEATEKPTATAKPTVTEEPKKAEELSISKQAADALSDGVTPATFTIEAKGGTEPYTYEWQKKVNTLQPDGVTNAVTWETIADFTNGEASLKITASAGEWTEKASIICVVTDADGNSVKSDEVMLKYTGDEAVVNELSDDEFLFYIDEVFKITNRGTCVTGTVANGKIDTGAEINIYKYDGTVIPTKIAALELSRKSIDRAEKGDSIGILLDSAITSDMVTKGEAIIAKESELVSATKLIGTLSVLSKEDGGKATPVQVGYKPQFYCVSDTTGEITDLNGAELLGSGCTRDYISVTLKTPNVYYVGQELTVRDGGKTVGTFTITKVIPE